MNKLYIVASFSIIINILRETGGEETTGET